VKRSRPRDREKVLATLRYQEISPHEISEFVIARVNHGRWIADCPICRGAEMVKETQDFLCGSCGAFGRVQWPKDIAAIEAALTPRAAPYQNWWPDEKVKDLVAENKERSYGLV
jgi:hypothetical protein